MMYQTVPFAALLAGLSAVSASPQTTPDLSNLPSCASAGALTGIQATGCQLTDVACICSNATFIRGLREAALETCDADSYQEAEQFAKQICSAAGVDIDAVIGVSTTTSATDDAAAADPTNTSAAPGDSDTTTGIADQEAFTTTPIDSAATDSSTDSGTASDSSSSSVDNATYVYNSTIDGFVTDEGENCTCYKPKVNTPTSPVLPTFTGGASSPLRGAGNGNPAFFTNPLLSGVVVGMAAVLL